jgi:TolB protein
MQALQSHPPLPADLTGTLALFRLVPPTNNYGASIVHLDGSDETSLGFGSEPSLSPDGSRVVYVGPADKGPSDGLYIIDLASGNKIHVPGTTTGDTHPLWSPDGSKIAFTRGPSSGLIGAPGPYHIMVMDITGSNSQQLTQGTSANYAMAWMPDGTRILYTLASRDGASLRMMNVDTGESSALTDLNYNGSPAISPDGKQVAFEEMLPLDKYGLFVSNLDGSNRKLLADGDPYVVTVPSWSPDGHWVIASVHDPDTTKHPYAMLALIQADTCQIIPLTNLEGYVTSWIP